LPDSTLGAAVLDYLDLESWVSWGLMVRFHYFLLFSGDERLVRRVTDPWRFPPSNHARDFELFLSGEWSGSLSN
jgi:hypothetical protein